MNQGKGVIALVAGLALGALLVVVAGPMVSGSTSENLWRGEASDCGPGMSKEELDTSLELGTAFLLANQRPPGNFAYEWNWQTQEDSTGDNEGRQAGAIRDAAVSDNQVVHVPLLRNARRVQRAAGLNLL